MEEIEVKWIKITTNMFDNKKIKHLRKLPDGDKVVLIWVMLLTMAGRCNAGGMIFLTENIPYTPKMLADELDFEESTVAMALRALNDLGMIVNENGFFTVAGWEEYQNQAKLEEIREYNRIAKQKSREKQKAQQMRVLSVLDKSRQNFDGQALDIDIDIKEIYKEKSDIPDFDILSAFDKFYEAYPKKGNMTSAKRKFVDKFVGVPKENHKAVANEFWYGTQAYLNDYKEQHGDDNYKFLPKFDKFLEEDLEYWAKKAREEKESE